MQAAPTTFLSRPDQSTRPHTPRSPMAHSTPHTTDCVYHEKPAAAPTTPHTGGHLPDASASRLSYDSSRSSQYTSPTIAPTPKTASSSTLVAYDPRKAAPQLSTTRLVIAHAG